MSVCVCSTIRKDLLKSCFSTEETELGILILLNSKYDYTQFPTLKKINR